MKISRFFILFAVWSGLTPFVSALTMIYPVDAIEDLWVLPADEFRQKYAGINVTGLGPSDEGWYVRYRHENLTCLFGPLIDREEARKRKWEMETVRDAAIRNRPSLNTSQVDFVRFTFSAVYGRRGDGAGGGQGGLGEMGRVSADGKSGPDGDLDGDGIANAQDDDMDGDGVANAQDDDMDGDGVPNGSDDYGFGALDGQLRGNSGLGGNGRDGPDGDLDGDRAANAADGDMDGDGIPNDQDPDGDGDGIPNAQDKYPYGKDDGPDGNSGSGRPAGSGADQSGAVADRNSGQDGSQTGQQGQSGTEQQMAGSQQGQRQVASNQRNSRAGQQGSQQGQQGQPGSQSSQSSQSGQQSSSQSQSSQSSQSGGPPSPPSSGGSGSPMDLLTTLMRMILGI